MSAFWIGVHWVHLLAMAFFVGGQLFLAAIVVPVVRGDEERRPVVQEVARRFGSATVWAGLVLVASGTAMASHENLWGDWRLQVKLGLVVAVGLLVWWHARRPDFHALEGMIFVVSLAIVWLGLALAH